MSCPPFVTSSHVLRRVRTLEGGHVLIRRASLRSATNAWPQKACTGRNPPSSIRRSCSLLVSPGILVSQTQPSCPFGGQPASWPDCKTSDDPEIRSLAKSRYVRRARARLGLGNEQWPRR